MVPGGRGCRRLLPGGVAGANTHYSRVLPEAAGPVETGTGRASLARPRPPYPRGVDNRSEIREFLATRRARITPQQAGLPAFGGRRRVAGLRREEVAMLAGVSVDYYIRLERGDLSGASDSVLDSLARALQLDDAERAHLFDLARAAGSRDPHRRRAGPRRVTPSVLRVLDAITTRRPGCATGGPTSWRPTRSAARSTGRCSTARRHGPTRRASPSWTRGAVEFYGDWERTASDMVAVLRAEAGRNPFDPD